MDEHEHQARCIAEEPSNELEQALARVMTEQMSKEEFLRIFLSANLYVLVNSEPIGNTLGNCTPMVISTNPDAPKMLVVFSSPLRSVKMTELHNDYRWPVMVSCAGALHMLGHSLGLALNPGCDLGFELAPEGAQQLKQALEGAEPGEG